MTTYTGDSGCFAIGALDFVKGFRQFHPPGPLEGYGLQRESTLARRDRPFKRNGQHVRINKRSKLLRPFDGIMIGNGNDRAHSHRFDLQGFKPVRLRGSERGSKVGLLKIQNSSPCVSGTRMKSWLPPNR